MSEWSERIVKWLAPVTPPELPVTGLRVDPGLVTGEVEGERATVAAPTIAPGIWAEVDVDSSELAQTLGHIWEEPLVPAHATTVGSDAHVAALVRAFADAVDADPSLLLRWRGHPGSAATDGDPWSGGELPELPPPARRPPESVPKRFGASGIRVGDEDLVEVLVRAYAAFGG